MEMQFGMLDVDIGSRVLSVGSQAYYFDSPRLMWQHSQLSSSFLLLSIDMHGRTTSNSTNQQLGGAGSEYSSTQITTKDKT
jgi:hypothetical protein